VIEIIIKEYRADKKKTKLCFKLGRAIKEKKRKQSVCSIDGADEK